ncbi:MAG: hypothetical protein LHV68_08300 [Elusimicrobia bacterium]|nr:hypothetical protein [Candidatus Liberimonas magnetica]
MKRALLIFLTISLLFAGTIKAFADDQALIDLGLKFLDNPGDFFFNLHSNNEDFSPLPSDRHGSVRFNFFPTFLPLTWTSLNLKFNVLKDNGTSPQIDLIGMYGDLLALHAIQSSLGDVKPTFSDYSIGAIVSKQANEDTKIFGGCKISTVQLKVQLSSSSVVEQGAFRLDHIDFNVKDTFLFTGIYHQTTENDYLVAQAGYGFTYKKIISRIMAGHKHFEIGMDIFPEGLLVIQPFMAWHWYF